MATTTMSNIFCGLVSGYQGEGNTATPENAAQAVAEALCALGAEVKVKPAVCVYHTDWGCPTGGEPVGAFALNNLSSNEILELCEKLRVSLKQSTLSVSLSDKGQETLGFTAQAEGNLREVGAKWQEAADEQMKATGTYVSCGIAETAEGLVVSAEANPEFVKDLDAWQKVVEVICQKIGATPVFEATRFNYLR